VRRVAALDSDEITLPTTISCDADRGTSAVSVKSMKSVVTNLNLFFLCCIGQESFGPSPSRSPPERNLKV
jgi:hypothetical protein